MRASDTLARYGNISSNLNPMRLEVNVSVNIHRQPLEEFNSPSPGLHSLSLPFFRLLCIFFCFCFSFLLATVLCTCCLLP